MTNTFYLAFSLQLTLTIVDEEDLEETTEVMVDLIENEVTLPKLHSVYFVHVMHTLTEQFVKGIDNSIVQVLIMLFCTPILTIQSTNLSTHTKRK
ncbi:TPA: hypothetical protein O4688_002454 [Staphylococcus aureus]|nr:hypothetical protein [Staphylococcus aureus]